jgi:hypothetical protein
MPAIAAALALSVLIVPAEVTVTREAYKGWPDSYRISNGKVDLVVVPQIGRIMRFGFVGEQNLLWENDALLGKTFPPDSGEYRNYGGDKLWPAPQSLWNWPPDSMLDGQPWEVVATTAGVRMTSPEGDTLRVRFRREITLSSDSPEVLIENSMHNLGQQAELSLWQVTQVNDPDSVTLVPEITAQQPAGWYGYGNDRLDDRYHTFTRDALVIRRHPTEARKFGARSKTGQLVAVKGATRFFSISPTFGVVPYPDQGSAQQVFSSPDPNRYMEMEHAGPLTRMMRNEIAMQLVRWRLQR